MKRALIFTIGIAVLAGCKTQVSTDLFTSDLIAATEGEAVTAPLVVGVEASSRQKCEETAQMVLTVVQSQMTTAEFIGCESVNFSTFARFRVQAAIIAYTEHPPLPAEAFSIGVKGSGGTFEVSYLTNPEATRAIWEALPEELTRFQTYALEPELSAVFNNDLRNTVTITTDDVFADGTPVQGTASRELPRRDQVELGMSDVTNAAFGNTANASHIVTFAAPE